MEHVQEKDERKKITHLLLNTPGACFLCLQDNRRDEDLNGGIIDLTTICRHLNINPRSLLSTSLKENGGTDVEDLEQHLCTFSVNLCPKCLSLTEKLNDVIIKLEKAKLMVNFHLHSFHQVLEEKKERINLLTRITTNFNSSSEPKLVQLLRDEVEKKSCKIVKKAEAAMPQLILSKCQTPAVSPPPPSHSPPISLEGIPSSSKKGSSRKFEQYRCPYCTKILGHSKFSLHLCCLHPDKLLSSYFPPSLPPSEEICRQVLHTKVVGHCENIPSTGKRARSGCYICGISYSKTNLLKHHFLVAHTDKLCEELNNLEKIPGKLLKGIKKKTSKPSTVPQTVKHVIKNLKKASLVKSSHSTAKSVKIKRNNCTICGKILADQSKMQRHQASLHPDQLFLECKPGWMGEDQFRGNCKKIFRGEVGKATCDKAGAKIYKCGYCPPGGRSTSFKGQMYMVRHLAYQHREIMEEKLKQDEVEWEERLEDDINYFEGDGGGDYMVVEEDASELDMKPMGIEELDEMYLEDEVDDGGTLGNMIEDTEQQLCLPDNQLASRIIIKMEVSDAMDTTNGY